MKLIWTVDNFGKIFDFFQQQKLVIQGEGCIKYAAETDLAKGGVGQMSTLADKGGRKVGEMLTLADNKGGGILTP